MLSRNRMNKFAAHNKNGRYTKLNLKICVLERMGPWGAHTLSIVPGSSAPSQSKRSAKRKRTEMLSKNPFFSRYQKKRAHPMEYTHFHASIRGNFLVHFNTS